MPFIILRHNSSIPKFSRHLSYYKIISIIYHININKIFSGDIKVSWILDKVSIEPNLDNSQPWFLLSLGLYSSERDNSKQVISKPKLAYQKSIMKTVEEEVLERDMGYPEASPEKVLEDSHLK